jgi:hypothetical protein
VVMSNTRLQELCTREYAECFNIPLRKTICEVGERN